LIGAARWFKLEETAPWFQKLALALRNSEHHTKAIDFFERAIDLDPNLIDACRGLAVVYEEQGYFNRVIELEIQNLTILLDHHVADVQSESEFDPLGREDLSRCYEMIGNAYHKIADTRMAMKHWRKAAETGMIDRWAILEYLGLLAESPIDSRWQETLELFECMQRCQSSEGGNRLTELIIWQKWPDNESPAFFFMIATAAKQTNRLAWLVQAYESAIAHAASQSHLEVIILKLGLVVLIKEYKEVFKEAEPLIEEIGRVTCVKHRDPIDELEECKKLIARDYICICNRKAMQAGRSDLERQYLQAIASLFEAGLEPDHLYEKLIYGEHIHVHLALHYRLNGLIEDAARILQPFVATRCALADSDPLSRAIGIWTLAKCLLALGDTDDAITLFDHVRSTHGWGCNGCGEPSPSNLGGSICQCCFEFFCESCSSTLESPGLTQFCMLGHFTLKLAVGMYTSPSDEIVFRHIRMKLEPCLNTLKNHFEAISH
jgi:tetratricopeptide (TPR) repeat protein